MTNLNEIAMQCDDVANSLDGIKESLDEILSPEKVSALHQFKRTLEEIVDKLTEVETLRLGFVTLNTEPVALDT